MARMPQVALTVRPVIEPVVFEYARPYTWADVEDLATEGWRWVGYDTPSGCYVMERPARRDPQPAEEAPEPAREGARWD